MILKIVELSFCPTILYKPIDFVVFREYVKKEYNLLEVKQILSLVSNGKIDQAFIIHQY